MGPVNTPPADEARSIFDDLGYTITGSGEEFRAVRDWKEVRVTAVDGDVDAPEDGTYRCFVTWDDRVAALARRLRAADPAYEWAVIGVGEDGAYEVARAPPTQ